MAFSLKAAIIFYSIVFLVFTSLSIYIGKRFISGMGLEGMQKWTVLFFCVVAAQLLPLPLFLRIADINIPYRNTLSIFCYILLAYMSFLFAFTVIKDVFIIMAAAIGKIKSLVSNELFHVDESRRIFLGKAINVFMVFFSGTLLGYGVYQARCNIEVKKVQVPEDKLNGKLKDLKIIQITDVHVGLSIKKDFIEKLVNKINALKADLIFFTGDAVDGTVSELREDFSPFRRLKATMGKYFVTGNHEYYSGAEDWIKELRGMGFKVLINENEIVEYNGEKILIAGVPDYKATDFLPNHHHDPAKAKETDKEYSYSILLAHQPKSIFDSSKEKYDLQVSGHTHGGQFFPWTFFVKLQQPYTSGLHKHASTWIYVSKGTGYWGPPVRVGSTAEITQIQIG